VHLHLDPLGGIAGDMFAACLLDAFPEHRPSVSEAVRLVAGLAADTVPHRDPVLGGSRFLVPEGHHGHHHHHTAWRDIRARIADAGLPEAAARHATGIFEALAAAEARVHGVEADSVTFHEVGAVDSIADIVAAGTLIAALGSATWSVAPLPLGGGRVRTAHGPLPVPAPATTLLLHGFALMDDGVGGERVTPTGAAILNYLAPAPRAGAAPARLLRSGVGFGSRTLPGLSNILRVLVFEDAAADAGTHRHLAVLTFEVDDQSAEDLATGLDRLRAVAGVHDVTQMPALGKKGRMAAHVQVLARPDAAELVAEACFRETTTIGLRLTLAEGRALPRALHRVALGGAETRVKIVRRPDGLSAKAESDDTRHAPSQEERARRRREAEALALTDGTGETP
jgi:uncharacterized protein (TIGR00299 family) protein